jgi:4-hydroxy-2-oxoheptanedioate aldolase
MVKRSARTAFRRSLREGAHLGGCFVKLGGLETIDVIAASGADFCVLDLEHSTLTEGQVFDQIAYARALGLPCLVRVAAVDPGSIGRWLDAGATGIQLADVATGQDARELVRASRYAPAGDRGMSPSQRDGCYGGVPMRDLQAGRAGEAILVAQIERDLDAPTLAAIASADIDVLFVGHADLAVRIGVSDTDDVNERMADITDRVAAAASSAGIAFGQHGDAGPRPRVHSGGTYRTLASDVVVLASGLKCVFEAER